MSHKWVVPETPTPEGLHTCSTFEHPRLFQDVRCIPNPDDAKCSLITFLAAVQKLGLPLLRETDWQPSQLARKGGPQDVTQDTVREGIDFVYKRVPEKDRCDPSKTYRRLIDEINVMCHPAVRDHPNIARLRGICWEIPLVKPLDKSEAWPILVYEKTQWGDLWQFARTPAGRELGLEERLKICRDIGRAIANMHSNHIIHGDIKPANVLMFKNKDGSLSAKVADFGYLAPPSESENPLELPKTSPWHASECQERSQLTPAEAITADVFSFGMVCLWFVFEKQLLAKAQGPDHVPVSYLDVIRYPHLAETMANRIRSANFMPDPAVLKLVADQQSSAVQLAQTLISGEDGLDAKLVAELKQLFEGTLALNPKERVADLRVLLEVNEANVNMHPIGLGAYVRGLADADFKLPDSLQRLYTCDFRLRFAILKALAEIVATNPESPCATHLALCHDLCFGSLKRTKKATSELEPDLAQGIASLDLEASDFAWDEMSHINSGVVRSYIEQDILNEAAAVTRQDLDHVEHLLSPGNNVALDIKCRLLGILVAQRQYKKAKKLNQEVITESTAALGASHRRTLMAKNYVAVVDYHHSHKDISGENKKVRRAAAQARESFQEWVKAFGERDPDTLDSLSLLVELLTEQTQWVSAKALQTELVQHTREALGSDHPTTLSRAATLSILLYKLEKYTDAKRVCEEVFEARKRVLGENHAATLTAMNRMALVYDASGDVDGGDAVTLEAHARSTQALRTDHRVCTYSRVYLARRLAAKGGDVNTALNSQRGVMRTYREDPILKRDLRGQYLQFLLLLEALIEVPGNSQEIFEHARGLASWIYEDSAEKLERGSDVGVEAILAITRGLLAQGLLEEAEESVVSVFEIRDAKYGQDHLDTLRAMEVMSEVFWKMGRQAEALGCLEDCIKEAEGLVGVEHGFVRRLGEQLEAWREEAGPDALRADP
ncbi:hypothetical protein QBC41DRAFT_304324 [Cercophora samala]|uniref:Protein kinase domain-containing protein n=1 Tax=Cercophora samala TaxID=330535 RepID=A0AA39ZBW3_9PEZI|nr:hypothetical protein QBC41DRAFT_304324 [Cercophora samala]